MKILTTSMVPVSCCVNPLVDGPWGADPGRHMLVPLGCSSAPRERVCRDCLGSVLVDAPTWLEDLPGMGWEHLAWCLPLVGA